MSPVPRGGFRGPVPRVHLCNGVAEGVKQKKKFARICQVFVKLFFVTGAGPAGNPPKSDKIYIIDRSVSIFKKNAFRSFDYLSNKKKSSKSFKWLLRNGVVHVTMNRHTDRRTDREPDTTIFSNTFFRKSLDFRSVRFAKRNISPLEDKRWHRGQADQWT